MTEAKVGAETLGLRAPPRPVTRLNRRTITIAVGSLAAAILGATLWSLRTTAVTSRDTPNELHNVDRVSHAEGLEQLPADYSKLPVAAATVPVPVLGAPLPGDLGGPMLRAEREGLADDRRTELNAPRSDPAADAARLARIDRQREAEEAAKAGLFFRGSSHVASVSSSASAGGVPISANEQRGGAPSLINQSASNASPTPQDAKSEFLKAGSDAATLNVHSLQRASSPYEIVAGTVIPAALITGINSDLPGQVIAGVTEGVYDSATGRHLLIPQGSRLLGQYDSQIAFGQRRVLLVWNRIVLPDASSISLDRLPGVDASGYAGVTDDVDWHWKQLLASAALSTLIAVSAELAAPGRENGQSQVVVATRQSIQDSVNQFGQDLTRRQLNVQPTLTVRPGFPVRVMVSKDLVLRPYQPLFFERSTQ